MIDGCLLLQLKCHNFIFITFTLCFDENFQNLGPGTRLGESPKNLVIQGILGINSTQISALKMNTGLPHLFNFESGPHGVAHDLTEVSNCI